MTSETTAVFTWIGVNRKRPDSRSFRTDRDSPTLLVTWFLPLVTLASMPRGKERPFWSLLFSHFVRLTV